jgi:hypothetical protein
MLEETQASSGPVTTFLPVGDIESHPLSWIIGEWAGMPVRRRTEHITQAIRRLRIANPHAYLVFCLGLDGLDEQSETQDKRTHIREIINWFWQQEQSLQRQFQSGALEPPEATLIITCREHAMVINEWLHGTFSQQARNSPPGIVPVADFTSNELLLAAEHVMQNAVGRFESTLFQHTQSGRSMSTSTVEIPSSPIAQEVLEALHHPAMWFALQGLSAEHQLMLLDGDSHALRLLAEQFLVWFYEKLRRRCPDWQEEDISEALGAVALRASQRKGTQFSYTIWREVGYRPYGLERNRVKRLYKEAVSAGLIHEVTAQDIWSWRHPCVGRYLAQKAQEEGWSDE